MNANELADEWDKYCGETLEWNSKSSKVLSTMLRQLQAENEALKAVVETYKEIMVTLEHKLRKELDGKVKELTKNEIKECADSVCHAWKKNGVGELYMEDFAIAILRKAQEK